MSRTLIYHTQLQIDGQATVTSRPKTEISMELSSISKSGLLLKCNKQSLETLLPKQPSLAPKQTVATEVAFGLPEVGKVDAACEIVSVRRLSRDTFELQLNFSNPEQRAITAVEHFVERKLRSQPCALEKEARKISVIHKKAFEQSENVQEVA